MKLQHSLLAMAMATASVNSFADAPQPERHVQQFLQALNSSGGKPIEQLSPQAARQVLIDGQRIMRFG